MMNFSWAAHFISLLTLLAMNSKAAVSDISVLAPGSCSTKCVTSEQRNPSSQTNLPLNKCSCSSGCKTYGDCCFDAEHTTRGSTYSRHDFACLTLDGKANFLAVRKCPASWEGSFEYCASSIGHLPPVTSQTTGVTYSNLFCAICNSDARNVVTWNVEVRCCDSQESNITYVYNRGQLMRAIKPSPTAETQFCSCKYFVHHGDYSLTDSLDLRQCEPRQLAPRCSPTWDDISVKELCESYVDPVFIGTRVYRNLHCARCNYAVVSQASCVPSIVQNLQSRNWNSTEILEYCQTRQLFSCVYYLRRGPSYGFNRLLVIKQPTCIPEEGARCCRGEIYDFRSKRCRKLG